MSLQLLDANGAPLSLDITHPAQFGEWSPGAASPPMSLRVRNTGDHRIDFIRVRAALHPDAQAGSARATVAATRFALHEHGAYAPEVEVGTLEPGDEKPVWVQWTVPRSTPAGPAVWACEALGAHA